MNDLVHLAQDLRAHAHEVPEHIGKLMRSAAGVLENRVFHHGQLDLADADVQPAPFPPPGEDD